MIDSDNRFTGLNMRLHPRLLESGYVSEAVNVRFTDGTISERRGMRATQWTRNGGGAYHNVYKPKGAAIYADPTGNEHIIIASGDGNVYATAPNNAARRVTMPEGETVTGDVKFVQCFDSLVMLRGADKQPLAMRNFVEGFRPVEQTPNEVSGGGTENPLDGTIPIPNASEATFFGNRLLVVDGRDEIAASDYLNYTRYQPTYSSFRVNQGTSGSIVGVHPIDSTTLAVFKTDSVYLVSNVYGDLADMRLEELTRNYGCAASGSITKVGSDLYFLSRRGVCSIAVTEQGHIQGVDVPLSRDIQPLIDQIDWTKASHARGVFAHNRLYLAVPLSTEPKQSQYSTGLLSYESGLITSDTGDLIVNYATDVVGNNAVLVYDFLTGAWAGVDLAKGLSVKDWVTPTINGVQRLCFVGNDGFIYLYDDPEFCGHSDIRKRMVDDTGFDDAFADNGIEMLVVTRAFGGGTMEQKRFHRVGFGLHTSNATVSVSAKGVDSFNEDAVATITRSRSRYIRPFDREPYDTSNANNDHGTEGRGDYAVVMGGGIRLCGTTPNRIQRFNERKLLRVSSSGCQVKIKNSTGNAKVDSLFVEFQPVEQFASTKL